MSSTILEAEAVCEQKSGRSGSSLVSLEVDARELFVGAAIIEEKRRLPTRGHTKGPVIYCLLNLFKSIHNKRSTNALELQVFNNIVHFNY